MVDYWTIDKSKKRLEKDLQWIDKVPTTGVILLQPKKSFPFFLKLLLIAESGPFKGIKFLINLNIPSNFPYQPPSLNLDIDHPFPHPFHKGLKADKLNGPAIGLSYLASLDEQGFIVYNPNLRDNTAWTPIYTLSQVINDTKAFLESPEQASKELSQEELKEWTEKCDNYVAKAMEEGINERPRVITVIDTLSEFQKQEINTAVPNLYDHTKRPKPKPKKNKKKKVANTGMGAVGSMDIQTADDNDDDDSEDEEETIPGCNPYGMTTQEVKNQYLTMKAPKGVKQPVQEGVINDITEGNLNNSTLTDGVDIQSVENQGFLHKVAVKITNGYDSIKELFCQKRNRPTQPRTIQDKRLDQA